AKVPAILKRFRQSVLAAACSGQLTADWREEQASLESGSDVAGRIGALRRQRYAEACSRAKQIGKPKPRDFDNYQPIIRDDLSLCELPDQWAWVDLRFLMDEQEPFCYGVVQPGENKPSGAFLIRAGDLKDGTVNTCELRRIPTEIDAQYSRS